MRPRISWFLSLLSILRSDSKMMVRANPICHGFDDRLAENIVSPMPNPQFQAHFWSEGFSARVSCYLSLNNAAGKLQRA
jgi:hypothetical protein